MPDAAQQRIAELEAELAALRAEMQDFTYTVSHDLRAPLRHILSYAQLVEEDAAHLLPAEVHGFLHTITHSARHMGLLMDGLTGLSRIGSANLQLASVPLLPLVQTLVTELALQHPQRTISWQLPTHMPAVQADATLLRQAVTCLLDNAVKFTAERREAVIAVSAQVDAATTDTPGTAVTLTIQDNGAGFNPALQDKLCRPFQRLHTTQQFPGIGMGLALVHKIMQRLEGHIALQGQPHLGCTVRLTFTRCNI